MAASTNPSGNHNPEHSSFNGGAVASTSNGNSGRGHDNSGTASAMKHNPGIATDWTTEEQLILETGLTELVSFSLFLLLRINRELRPSMFLQITVIVDAFTNYMIFFLNYSLQNSVLTSIQAK